MSLPERIKSAVVGLSTIGKAARHNLWYMKASCDGGGELLIIVHGGRSIT